MRSSPLGLPLATLLALFAAAPAYSTEYLPLATGNQWSYASIEGSSEVQTVVGTAPVWGVSTSVIDHTESTFNEGLENYWTTGSDGDVFLWGFNRTLDGFGWLYDPPILYVDAPLFVGKTWSSEVDVYELPDTTYFATFNLLFTVHEDVLLSVPAGAFQSYGIGYDAGGGASMSILGTLGRALRGTGPSVWFSDGTGEVQYSSASELFRLVSVNVPNSTSATSWGAIKGLYR
ncbi:MAG: hypothetical protein ACKVU1_02735 [bacterium]